ELADILCPVDDLELAVGIEIAGVPRVIPAVSREGFSRRLGVLVVSLEQTRALDLNFTVFGDTDLDTRDGWPHRIGAHLAVGLNADEHRGFSGPVQLLEVDADGAVELEEIGADGLAGRVRHTHATHAQSVAQRPIDQQIAHGVLEPIEETDV